ncbi:MAG TPA: alanine racemase [Balneolaceae bacterium]|nr:alanine racemase [Balneolaceae bacterium]
MVEKSNSIVTINIDTLNQNVDRLLGYVDKDTRVMAVVKADAYGHGAVEVAGNIQSKVGAFAVNDIQEGVELRENGINKPILVFCVPEASFVSQYRVHNLTATISAEEHFELLPNGTSYHLNFDTGMGRLGFRPEEAQRVSKLVKDNGELFCTGIYSHYATADDPGSELVLRQHEQFKTVLRYFPKNLATHISNTGATAFYETEQFNLVRLGIGMYGYPPGETVIEGVNPVLSWKTRLVQTKKIVAKMPVSYGAKWKAPSDGFLGVLPVGYDDGLRRNLSGQISVRIGSKVYDIVGTITMNYCMVFLRDDDYEPGTEVELIYKDSNAGDWARKLGTISYEILTNISPKIPREYVSLG